jgi:ribosomal protein L11 methyltransferase
MPTDQLSAALTKDQAYALVDAVMERDDLALTASAHEDPETGEWVFEATCDSPPDIEAFSILAREVLDGEVNFSLEMIDPEIDWVTRSLEGLPPVEAGGFYVYGSHADGQIPSGLIPIHIEAAQAFGTGHHETTTGCLEAIDRVLKRKKPKYPIDVGTGTGVLAIALAKRLRVPVIASDIDPVAVRTTVENARINNVGNFVVPIEAAGLEHRMIAGNAPYDFVVANILAGPLSELAPSIAKATQSGASVVLSGILERQARGVTAAYARQGMTLRQKIVRKEWATLILERA